VNVAAGFERLGTPDTVKRNGLKVCFNTWQFTSKIFRQNAVSITENLTSPASLIKVWMEPVCTPLHTAC
jgi:hypothetical protein